MGSNALWAKKCRGHISTSDEYIFHEYIGIFMEICIDDVVIKSDTENIHLNNLRLAFNKMRRHNLKMNPLKCAFGVFAGYFLGFLIHKKGVEVDKNKAKAIIEAKPPSNNKELQIFLGKVNYLRRFISNLLRRTKVFTPLIKLKKEEEFLWTQEHQETFKQIKTYISALQ